MTISAAPHRLRNRVLAALVAGVAAVALLGAPGAEAKVRTGPAGLAFYHPPKSLPGGHGSLIWARKAGGLVPLKRAASTKLVLYTSITPQGKRVAVSGSVSIPKGKPPKGGWPVISYAHGTTGTADACAPSRNRKGGPAEGYISYIDPQLNAWLAAGYAVVRTDYQGLGTPGPHAYLIGRAEGRSVLDIVRAARQLNPAIGKRFLISGHSQGGHAALFAAGLAKGYAPDLSLRGTVAYAPASRTSRSRPRCCPSITTPELPLGARDPDRPGRDDRIDSCGADQARACYSPTRPSASTRWSTSSASRSSPPLSRLGGLAPSTLLRPGADLTALYDVLDKQNPAVTTTAPVLLAQGDADTTVPKSLQRPSSSPSSRPRATTSPTASTPASTTGRSSPRPRPRRWRSMSQSSRPGVDPAVAE